MKIEIKRAYDGPSKADGYRVLVDRLWPRGVKKEELNVDEWCKDIAPSNELREWFNHEPQKFPEFTVRYKKELKQTDAADKLLKRAKGHDKLTLVYGAKDTEMNQAVVLKQYLEPLL